MVRTLFYANTREKTFLNCTFCHNYKTTSFSNFDASRTTLRIIPIVSSDESEIPYHNMMPVIDNKAVIFHTNFYSIISWPFMWREFQVNFSGPIGP